jgi:hypothetical protein
MNNQKVNYQKMWEELNKYLKDTSRFYVQTGSKLLTVKAEALSMAGTFMKVIENEHTARLSPVTERMNTYVQDSR